MCDDKLKVCQTGNPLDIILKEKDRETQIKDKKMEGKKMTFGENSWILDVTVSEASEESIREELNEKEKEKEMNKSQKDFKAELESVLKKIPEKISKVLTDNPERSLNLIKNTRKKSFLNDTRTDLNTTRESSSSENTSKEEDSIQENEDTSNSKESTLNTLYKRSLELLDTDEEREFIRNLYRVEQERNFEKNFVPLRLLRSRKKCHEESKESIKQNSPEEFPKEIPEPEEAQEKEKKMEYFSSMDLMECVNTRARTVEEVEQKAKRIKEFNRILNGSDPRIYFEPEVVEKLMSEERSKEIEDKCIREMIGVEFQDPEIGPSPFRKSRLSKDYTNPEGKIINGEIITDYGLLREKSYEDLLKMDFHPEQPKYQSINGKLYIIDGYGDKREYIPKTYSTEDGLETLEDSYILDETLIDSSGLNTTSVSSIMSKSRTTEELDTTLDGDDLDATKTWERNFRTNKLLTRQLQQINEIVDLKKEIGNGRIKNMKLTRLSKRFRDEHRRRKIISPKDKIVKMLKEEDLNPSKDEGKEKILKKLNGYIYSFADTVEELEKHGISTNLTDDIKDLQDKGIKEGNIGVLNFLRNGNQPTYPEFSEGIRITSEKIRKLIELDAEIKEGNPTKLNLSEEEMISQIKLLKKHMDLLLLNSCDEVKNFKESILEDPEKYFGVKRKRNSEKIVKMFSNWRDPNSQEADNDNDKDQEEEEMDYEEVQPKRIKNEPFNDMMLGRKMQNAPLLKVQKTPLLREIETFNRFSWLTKAEEANEEAKIKRKEEEELERKRDCLIRGERLSATKKFRSVGTDANQSVSKTKKFFQAKAWK